LKLQGEIMTNYEDINQNESKIIFEEIRDCLLNMINNSEKEGEKINGR